VHIANHELVWTDLVHPAEALGRHLLPHVGIYLAQKDEKGENTRRV